MRRLALAAVTAVSLSTPAFACGHHGLAIGLGPLYLAVGHAHPCPEVIAAVPVVVPVPVPGPVPMVMPVPIPAPLPVIVEEEPMVPPPMVVAPAPVMVVPAPVVVAAPPPPAPAVVVAPPVVAPPPPDEPVRLAVKWMPGLSTAVQWDKMGFGSPTLGQNFGLEYRLSHYVALRADLEMRSGAMNIDVPGLKFSLLPHSRIRPFASGGLSLGKNAADPNNGIAVGFVAGAGLDVMIFRWLFLTGEVRYHSYPAECCSLPRVSGLVGLGAQFF
jgi:hypothetical protein